MSQQLRKCYFKSYKLDICILGKFSFLKEWSGIGTGCPGKWWSHHPWRCSKKSVDIALQDKV